MKFPIQYQNGNATVTLEHDGTRVVECDTALDLKYPMNIDVRLSRRCRFGMNPSNGKAVCGFCHESATTDGKDASLDDIQHMLNCFAGLPSGTEIAVGINQFTKEVEYFLTQCSLSGWVVNATINQASIGKEISKINSYINHGMIKGLGVSYRPNMDRWLEDVVKYDNTVVHVIAGIDPIDDVKDLTFSGVKKILVLGEKDFGFNKGKVKLTTESHRQWYFRIFELFKLFDIVSFDNLALEQLNVKRFVKDWETTYQHEHSFYANAVDRTFSPSSRSPDVSPMMPVDKYFALLK